MRVHGCAAQASARDEPDAQQTKPLHSLQCTAQPRLQSPDACTDLQREQEDGAAIAAAARGVSVSQAGRGATASDTVCVSMAHCRAPLVVHVARQLHAAAHSKNGAPRLSRSLLAVQPKCLSRVCREGRASRASTTEHPPRGLRRSLRWTIDAVHRIARCC